MCVFFVLFFVFFLTVRSLFIGLPHLLGLYIFNEVNKSIETVFPKKEIASSSFGHALYNLVLKPFALI